MVKDNGYTLVEVLVASALFAGLSLMLATSLFSILKGKSKAEIIKEVRQNGAQTMNQMIKKIAAGQVDTADCGATMSDLTITSQSGGETVFSCTGSNITQNDQALLNSEAVVASSCQFSCQTVGNNKQVEIEFTLRQEGSPDVEEQSEQDFREVILVRNE